MRISKKEDMLSKKEDRHQNSKKKKIFFCKRLPFSEESHRTINAIETMDVEKLVDHFFESFGPPGSIMIVNHLQSERGRAMNGRRVVVVGADPPKENRRIQVKLLDPNTQKPTGGILQIKTKNLVDPENYCTVPSRSTLKKDEAIQFLQRGLQKSIADGLGKRPKPEDARDPYRRIELVKKCLPCDLPEKSKCMDLMVEDPNEFEHLKSLVVPACVGDGNVDFTRFGCGIIGNGQDGCTICQTDIQGDLIRLPCNHRFHVDCVKPWLKEHTSCPSCRKELTNPWETYLFEISNQQIQKRFDEWFVSGMCERCQAVNHEDDPVVTVTDESGMPVTMNLSVARANGYTGYETVQGQRFDEVNILSDVF